MSGKKGDLIECSDPAIREYILDVNRRYLEEYGKSFIIHDLPPCHLFVEKEAKGKPTFTMLIDAINKLVDDNTFLEENR